jgi:predicted transposase/invertase (TIGR01784 family)
VIQSGLSSQEEVRTMTLAEKCRQEGELKGELNALRKMAFKLFNLGFSLEQVAECTDLPLKEIQELQQQAMKKESIA